MEGVSMVTRGEAARAASRVRTAGATGVLGTVPGTVGEAPPAWLGLAGGFGALGLTCVDCCCWAARRCLSASGAAKKYCQPSRTAIDSTMATMRFLLSSRMGLSATLAVGGR